MKPDGGPAFARPFSLTYMNEGIYDQDGMSLRDYFAAKAMQGLLSSPNLQVLSPRALTHSEQFDLTASIAYEMADAMISEREKQ